MTEEIQTASFEELCKKPFYKCITSEEDQFKGEKIDIDDSHRTVVSVSRPVYVTYKDT